MEILTNKLTQREKEVLELVVNGYENSEIAEKLFITVHTVKVHISSIIKKLGAKNRTNAVISAIKENILKVDDLK